MAAAASASPTCRIAARCWRCPPAFTRSTAASAAEIDEATLAPLFAEPADAVELLIFGTGDESAPLGAALRAGCARRGIMVEPMATGAAVRTYNMLLDEDRRVAAVLIAV